MLAAMDLNASPLPEEDEETSERHFDAAPAPPEEERTESGVEIARREREERRRRLKRERPEDRPIPSSQPSTYSQSYHNRNIRRYDINRLPPGWLECPSSGQDVNYIIPSKVPLGEAFNDCVVPGRRYSFRQVIHQQRVLSRTLGLVIDLTNTNRYYQESEWRNEGLKYVKIQCSGRDCAPDNESVNTFVHKVSSFLNQQKGHPKKYIFVHCTHGHNRTGYMIVHYLMRTTVMSVAQAIQVFAEARPPGIYKPDYIDALYAFYHEKKPEGFTYPAIPDWKRASELDLNGEAAPDDDDGASAAPVHESNALDVEMTNDDILGDAIPFDQQKFLQQFCYQALFGVPQRSTQQFPGSHPVSLDRDNLQLLRQRYYYATWKADGTRYMMLITSDGCYLIDRNFSFRRVQMRFPCRNPNDVKGCLPEKFHNYTLLDGEMIIDTLPDTKKQERRYLIYDLMAINHVSVTERPFCDRWRMLEKEVIEPRNYERQCIIASMIPNNPNNLMNLTNPNYRYEMEPFRVRRKDFWPLMTVSRLLTTFITHLSHKADGLIFQGWDDPYVPRTHEGLLKWKYPEMNSVDFLFEVDNDGKELLYLNDRSRKRLMEGSRVTFTGMKESSDPSYYSKKIIECSLDAEADVWVCSRVRTDKSNPNDFHTYRKVMRSIKDNITQEVLLNEIEEILKLPMYEDRKPKDTKSHNPANARRR